MKQNPQWVNGFNAPRYHLKIDNDAWMRRLLWWTFRRFLLNEDYYRVTIRFTGPRPRGTSNVSTLKRNSTARRYYIEPRIRPAWR